MAKINATGRSRYTRHIRLDHSMLACEAYRALSGNAVKVLLHLASLDDGKNNGEIALSVRRAGEASGLGRDPAARALVELTEAGFIVPTSIGAFSVKVARAATTWRLTWVAWPGRSGPTNDFLG